MSACICRGLAIGNAAAAPTADAPVLFKKLRRVVLPFMALSNLFEDRKASLGLAVVIRTIDFITLLVAQYECQFIAQNAVECF